MRSFSYILFLSLICNFAYGQAIIKGINYDESKVPDFVLPDDMPTESSPCEILIEP